MVVFFDFVIWTSVLIFFFQNVCLENMARVANWIAPARITELATGLLAAVSVQTVIMDIPVNIVSAQMNNLEPELVLR